MLNIASSLSQNINDLSSWSSATKYDYRLLTTGYWLLNYQLSIIN